MYRDIYYFQIVLSTFSCIMVAKLYINLMYVLSYSGPKISRIPICP